MKNLCFDRHTPFAVVTTVVHRGISRSSAHVEFTFASGSFRLTFRDPASLKVLTNAFDQLSYDALDDPDAALKHAILTRVFNREAPNGAPNPFLEQPLHSDDF